MSRFVIRFSFVLTFLVLIGTGAAFYYASQISNEALKKATNGATLVSITSKACEPNEVRVSAGRVSFHILNKSDRVVEWEILDGVMVVEERENIAPGFTRTLTTQLEPGEYEMTCGLLSNPRGKLHVMFSAEASTRVDKPSLTAFIGPLAEYKLFLAAKTNDLLQIAGNLADAVRGGNLDEAKRLYEATRITYAHIAPVSNLFSDLDMAINARADYFEKREDDPAFTGLHRLEYGLFSKNNTEKLGPVADELVAKIAVLQARLHDLRITPEKMIGGAASLIGRLATPDFDFEDDRYAHIDLDVFFATLVGVGKIIDLVHPIMMKTNADLMQTIDNDFMTISDMRQAYRQDSRDKLRDEDKIILKKKITPLATDLDKLRDILG